MDYVFVQAAHDYSDEFDVECCFVSDRSTFEAELEAIKQAFAAGTITADREYYFGTNEALRFSDYYSFLNGLDIQECSEQFYDEFKKLTRYGSVGFNVFDVLFGEA